MPHLKLIKLMYLAERASLQAHGYLMTGDRFSAMPHGPVLSLTLDHINDGVRSEQDGWDSWISDKANHTVGLVQRHSGLSLKQEQVSTPHRAFAAPFVEDKDALHLLI